MTSLPYLDEDLNEKSRNMVNQLIKEEMQKMEEIDYLGIIPLLINFRVFTITRNTYIRFCLILIDLYKCA